MNLVVESYECCVCVCWFTFKNKEYLKRHTINEHEPSGAIWMLCMLIYFQKLRIFEETQDKRCACWFTFKNEEYLKRRQDEKNMNLVEPYESCACWFSYLNWNEMCCIVGGPRWTPWRAQISKSHLSVVKMIYFQRLNTFEKPL